MIVRNKAVKGFTLIEVIIVMSVVWVLSMMIVFACIGSINKAREKVCQVNCVQIKRMYDDYLKFEDRGHSDVGFNTFVMQYGDEICPNKASMSYVEGNVMCEVHGAIEEKEDGEVTII